MTQETTGNNRPQESRAPLANIQWQHISQEVKNCIEEVRDTVKHHTDYLTKNYSTASWAERSIKILTEVLQSENDQSVHSILSNDPQLARIVVLMYEEWSHDEFVQSYYKKLFLPPIDAHGFLARRFADYLYTQYTDSYDTDIYEATVAVATFDDKSSPTLDLLRNTFVNTSRHSLTIWEEQSLDSFDLKERKTTIIELLENHQESEEPLLINTLELLTYNQLRTTLTWWSQEIDELSRNAEVLEDLLLWLEWSLINKDPSSIYNNFTDVLWLGSDFFYTIKRWIITCITTPDLTWYSDFEETLVHSITQRESAWLDGNLFITLLGEISEHYLNSLCNRKINEWSEEFEKAMKIQAFIWNLYEITSVDAAWMTKREIIMFFEQVLPPTSHPLIKKFRYSLACKLITVEYNPTQSVDEHLSSLSEQQKMSLESIGYMNTNFERDIEQEYLTNFIAWLQCDVERAKRAWVSDVEILSNPEMNLSDTYAQQWFMNIDFSEDTEDILYSIFTLSNSLLWALPVWNIQVWFDNMWEPTIDFLKENFNSISENYYEAFKAWLRIPTYELSILYLLADAYWKTTIKNDLLHLADSADHKIIQWYSKFCNSLLWSELLIKHITTRVYLEDTILEVLAKNIIEALDDWEDEVLLDYGIDISQPQVARDTLFNYWLGFHTQLEWIENYFTWLWESKRILRLRFIFLDKLSYDGLNTYENRIWSGLELHKHQLPLSFEPHDYQIAKQLWFMDPIPEWNDDHTQKILKKILRELSLEDEFQKRNITHETAISNHKTLKEFWRIKPKNFNVNDIFPQLVEHIQWMNNEQRAAIVSILFNDPTIDINHPYFQDIMEVHVIQPWDTIMYQDNTTAQTTHQAGVTEENVIAIKWRKLLEISRKWDIDEPRNEVIRYQLIQFGVCWWRKFLGLWRSSNKKPQWDEQSWWKNRILYSWSPEKTQKNLPLIWEYYFEWEEFTQRSQWLRYLFKRNWWSMSHLNKKYIWKILKQKTKITSNEWNWIDYSFTSIWYRREIEFWLGHMSASLPVIIFDGFCGSYIGWVLDLFENKDEFKPHLKSYIWVDLHSIPHRLERYSKRLPVNFLQTDTLSALRLLPNKSISFVHLTWIDRNITSDEYMVRVYKEVGRVLLPWWVIHSWSTNVFSSDELLNALWFEYTKIASRSSGFVVCNTQELSNVYTTKSIKFTQSFYTFVIKTVWTTLWRKFIHSLEPEAFEYSSLQLTQYIQKILPKDSFPRHTDAWYNALLEKVVSAIEYNWKYNNFTVL